MKFQKILPSRLSKRQKESYNFQKASAVLADYGFQAIKLSDDWCGADFIAQHIDGEFIKVQLKGRITVAEKYRRKDLWILFPTGSDWYIIPHDALLDILIRKKVSIEKTESWMNGGYSIGKVSKELRPLLEPYMLYK